MNDIFFTSDQHFNHANVINLMSRPYLTIEEMNEAFVANHNELVSASDRVYHLGDFAWRYSADIIKRLNGNHYLIKGNHDRLGSGGIIEGFIWVKDTFNLKVGTDSFFLSHYAHRVWNRSHYGAYHLYGHSHGMLPGLGRSLDVGVDAWNYKPVHIEQVLDKLQPIQEYVNHHP